MVKKKIVPKRKRSRSLIPRRLVERLDPLDRSEETMKLERIRDLRLTLATLSNSMWPVPVFDYGAHVLIRPLALARARIIGLHILGSLRAVQYDVRYFHRGEQCKARVFEDELEACP